MTRRFGTDLPQPTGPRILRLRQVIEMTGLARTTIYRLLDDETSGFPKPIKLSARAIGWHLDQVQRYLARRPEVGSATSLKAGA